MQLDGDVKTYRRVQSHRQSQPTNNNLKEMIALVHQKQKHYKKALSQMHASIQYPSNLKYLFNSSNCINVPTPQQKEIIKEESLARGSIPQFQLQNEKDPRKRNLRLKSQKQKKHKSMVKKSLKKVNQSNQLKRYQTQPYDQGTQQLKRSILCVPRQLPSIVKKEQSRNKIRVSIAQIKRTGKNTQKLERIYYLLKAFNPFFAKVDKTVGVCLLRIGQAYQLKQQNTLYELHSSQARFFIILDGQVKIKGKESMHKLCAAGQTLLEESLFQQQAFSGPLQKAIVTSQALILEIGKADYEKLLKELYKFGYKYEVQELISLIRRNFILKNWLRNKYKHIYNS